jgi:hypothetical protein
MSTHNSPGPDEHGGPSNPGRQGGDAPPPDKDALTIQALYAIIDKLSNAGQAPPPKKDKIDKPEVFDGKVKSKLPEFLASLDHYFRHNAEIYRGQGKDQDKVTFAGTRLSGQVKTWYMNFYRPGVPEPQWFHDYPVFVEELRARFGIHDEEEWAEAQIKKLRMTDDQRFDDFIMKFELYKERIADWSDRTWYSTLFTAVAPRIRNWIANLSTPAPTTYTPFKSLVSVHDLNYQRVKDHDKEEASRKSNSGNARSATTSSAPRSSAPRSFTPRYSAPTSTSTSATNNSSSSSSSSSDKKRATTPKPSTDSPLAKVLTSAGHLTPEEKERRRRDGLCGYCGDSGHFAAKCPKNNSKPKETKAHATATISEVSDNSDIDEDSENVSEA